jgi:hypothetical protein
VAGVARTRGLVEARVDHVREGVDCEARLLRFLGGVR